jgi:hypothetical protein
MKQMETEIETRSIESTEESRGEKAPLRGRRGFLKKAAVTGILGMSGVTVGTGAVSATKTKTNSETKFTMESKTVEYTAATEATDVTEPSLDIAPMDYRGFDKVVEIYGRGPGWVDYSIDSNGDIISAYSTEGHDDVGNDVAYGSIYEGETDAYYVQYGVDFIGDSGGDVDYYIYEV